MVSEDRKSRITENITKRINYEYLKHQQNSKILNGTFAGKIIKVDEDITELGFNVASKLNLTTQEEADIVRDLLKNLLQKNFAPVCKGFGNQENNPYGFVNNFLNGVTAFIIEKNSDISIPGIKPEEIQNTQKSQLPQPKHLSPPTPQAQTLSKGTNRTLKNLSVLITALLTHGKTSKIHPESPQRSGKTSTSPSTEQNSTSIRPSTPPTRFHP